MDLLKNNDNKTKALKEKLAELKRQEEEKRAKLMAEKTNLPHVNLNIIPIEAEALSLITEKESRAAKLAIIRKVGRKLQIALENPQEEPTKKILADLEKKGYQISLFISSISGLEKAWAAYQAIPSKSAKRITGQIEIEKKSLEKLKKEINNLDDVKKRIQEISAEQASTLVEILLAGALETGASDVHLENEKDKTNLRYRIDGILQDVVFLSHKSARLAVNRLKLLAGMKLNIHDQAQDGRFTISLEGVDVEIRVSCIPSAYGENIVMRVLNPKDISLELSDLGMRSDILSVIEKEIQRPNGIVITTGPTGSGKTTLLYAIIKKINRPEVKIITLEDPIEYHLPGITQTQVESKKGYSFAKGLRAILRQDPDVILVGEIRDHETAEIAIRSSLTGHLVFSTLHTNDAAGAILRFLDIDIEASILAPSINLLVAQRLIRKVCPKCGKLVSPSEKQLIQIKKALQGLPQDVSYPPLDKKLKIYQAQGCASCNQTGYRGRTGIFELISIDEEIERLIATSPNHIQLVEKARQKGMTNLYQDSILKVLNRITTLEEVERVVGPMTRTSSSPAAADK